jgi:hypothetical protein
MTRTDGIVLMIVLSVIIAAGMVADGVFENMAHLEDEFAYLWQARVIAEGKLSLPSPDHPKKFLVPFVIDYQGERFGKYPLGWPVILSLAIRVGIRNWINPLLAGLAIWLVYQLGKKITNQTTGLISVILLGTSPIFLIQSGTLLSHTWSLVLSVGFILPWMDVIERKDSLSDWWKAVISGLSLGLIGLTRPLTMVGISIPFLFQGLYFLFRGSRIQRYKVLMIGGIALLLASAHFLWQFAITGNLLTNPYTLWWPYDKYGFGPGYGVLPDGHSPFQAYLNTKHSLRAGLSDLFGWGMISWIFLPFGLIASWRNHRVHLLSGIFISLIFLYSAYWVGARLLGPRYYFEALPGLVILSALGICWLAGWNNKSPDKSNYKKGWLRYRAPFVTSLVSVLIFLNLNYYLPFRMESLRGLYGIERSDLAPFYTTEAQELTPALVIVHSEVWMPYGSLLELESPNLDSPFIFAWSARPNDYHELANAFFDRRNIIHYFPNTEPGVLYTSGYLIE